MTDPYEFSRRVRCDADWLGIRIDELWKNPKKVQDSVDGLRALANEYDSRVARYEAEIAVLRAEVDRLSTTTTHSIQSPIAVPTFWPATGGTAKPTT